MKLNDDERLACKKARESWVDESPETSESVLTDAMFAAGIAYAQKLLTQARADEREACAKICDRSRFALDCAAAIRARKDGQ